MAIRRVVGWGCLPGEVCAYCGEPATVYVTENELDSLPACGRCAGDAPDPIAKIFAKAIRKTQEDSQDEQ